MHFDNIQTMKVAVELGSGFSIMPDRIMRQEIGQGLLKAIPLEAPGLFRPLGIIHRKKKKFSRAAQMFLALLGEEPS
jgi:DNA-binding transcriptional LysR family regulator